MEGQLTAAETERNADGMTAGLALRLGLTKTLLREGVWTPDLVGRVTWDTDSGPLSDDGVSLGGGFLALSPETSLRPAVVGNLPGRDGTERQWHNRQRPGIRHPDKLLGRDRPHGGCR